MPTETDCKQWLDDVNVDTDDAVYSLYNAVFDEQGCGDFQCFSRGEELFVKPSSSEQWLRIASRRAREDLLELLKARYCGGEDVPAWYKRRGGSMCKVG